MWAQKNSEKVSPEDEEKVEVSLQDGPETIYPHEWSEITKAMCERAEDKAKVTIQCQDRNPNTRSYDVFTGKLPDGSTTGCRQHVDGSHTFYLSSKKGKEKLYNQYKRVALGIKAGFDKQHVKQITLETIKFNGVDAAGTNAWNACEKAFKDVFGEDNVFMPGVAVGFRPGAAGA